VTTLTPSRRERYSAPSLGKVGETHTTCNASMKCRILIYISKLWFLTALCMPKTLWRGVLFSLIIAMSISPLRAERPVEQPSRLQAQSTRDALETWIGSVANVTEDGQIVLEDGMRFHQWALQISDVDAARTFLVGRRLYCREVIADEYGRSITADQGYVGIFDCDVLPSWASGPRKSDLLSLYAWGPDLGFGRIGCLTRDQMPANVISIQHITGYNYQCNGMTSLRQRLD
jgi:hypothetical protein